MKKEVEKKSYGIAEILATIRRLKLINKREFLATIMDKNRDMFMIHVIILFTAPTLAI